MEINNCTRCGKEFDKFRIMTIFHMETQRIKENGVWEEIPNLNNTSKEILCEECFDELTHVLEGMNKKHEE